MPRLNLIVDTYIILAALATIAAVPYLVVRSFHG